MGREIHHCPGCEAEIFDDMERCGRPACQPEALAAAEAARAAVRSARIDALWELVSHHLSVGRHEDRARLEERFRVGAAEHDDDWTTWPDERFDAEVLQELDDVVLYRAMQRAARVTRGGAR